MIDDGTNFTFDDGLKIMLMIIIRSLLIEIRLLLLIEIGLLLIEIELLLIAIELLLMEVELDIAIYKCRWASMSK